MKKHADTKVVLYYVLHVKVDNQQGGIRTFYMVIMYMVCHTNLVIIYHMNV